MEQIDLSPEQLAVVRAILAAFVPEFEVRVFGSRARRAKRKTSDLDIAVMTRIPLGPARVADLREAFVESALPFKVDIVDWAAASERFREVIARDFVVIQPSVAACSSDKR